MRTKRMTLALGLALAAALLSALSVNTVSARVTGTAWQAAASAPMQATPRKTKKKAKGKGSAAVPKGVQACLDELIKIAGNDPLVAYEGRPETIINDHLLWNDAKSNCSIGSDSSLRLKLLDLSNAWRMKDAGKVRSLLSEIKSAAPQG